MAANIPVSLSVYNLIIYINSRALPLNMKVASIPHTSDGIQGYNTVKADNRSTDFFKTRNNNDADFVVIGGIGGCHYESLVKYAIFPISL